MNIKRHKVISGKGFKMRPPVWMTLTLVIACSHWGAPGWLWGVFGTFVGIVWVIWFIELDKGDDYVVDIDKMIELKILKEDK
jgi:hypothetical protein